MLLSWRPLLLALAHPPVAAPFSAAPLAPPGIARFGAAGHFAYQVPYGRDNQPWSAWPINTTEQLRVLKGACGGAQGKRQCVCKFSSNLSEACGWCL